MDRQKNTETETAREEDYRDYDKRNIGEGWPYADEDLQPASRNAPYGTSTSNLDESGNVGAEISGEPAMESHGGPSVAASLEHRSIEDDGLEEKISERLETIKELDPDLITVTVHNRVATLEGHVDTESLRMRAQTLALEVKDVRGCVNRLVLIGADSHIPSDSDI
jgi:hypothetical protein